MSLTLRSSTIWAFTFLALLGSASVSQAALVTYGFTGVTSNNTVNVTTGEDQLFVDVSDDTMPGYVKFTFRNEGPLASSITDVYFDDGSLLGIYSIEDNGDDGVDFGLGASPGNLPGGNVINFHTTAGAFSADSDPPAQPNGVNPGESFSIIFELLDMQTFDDVIDAIALAFTDPGEDVEGALRIGIHVQGFSNGGSESFVNDDGGGDGGNPIVPEPASMTLWALGMALCGGAGYWKKRRTAASV